MTVIDYATGDVAHLTEAEARRLTERIRTALDRVSSAWADLAERVAEAYQRRADLALGYGSWAEYAEAELKPAEGIAADVRRQLVGVLSAEGMSTRAIAPVVGVSGQRVRQIVAEVASDLPPEPERIDRETGEVLEPKPVAPTHYATTRPEVKHTAANVVGLDGKTYTRPQTAGPKEAQKETPMPAAPSRLAIPQPPKYGGNRPKHNQVIGNVIVSAQGLCIVADEIQALDGSINNEEAASYASDLSRIIRSLKRVQQLLTKEV